MSDEFTVAKAPFFAGGIAQTKDVTFLNVTSPEYQTPEVRTRHETRTSVVVDTNVTDGTKTTSIDVPGLLVITANSFTRKTTDPCKVFTGLEFTASGLREGDTITMASISSSGACTTQAGSYPINISNAIISNPSHYDNIRYIESILTVTDNATISGSGGSTSSVSGGGWSNAGKLSSSGSPSCGHTSGCACRLPSHTDTWDPNLESCMRCPTPSNTMARFWSVKYQECRVCADRCRYGSPGCSEGCFMDVTWNRDNPICFFGTDPLAQSFRLPMDCFVTEIDVFFQKVDLNAGSLFLQIRTMEDGMPTGNIIAEELIDPADVYTSEDSNTEHAVIFKYPVFVEGGREYCFVIGGPTPETRVWVARMGDPTIDNPNVIVDNQPAPGISFRSQNAATWTPEPAEDLKYIIHVATFYDQVMHAQFEVFVTPEKLPNDPFESEASTDRVRILIPDHGLVVGDVVDISLFEDHAYTITPPPVVIDGISVSGVRFGQVVKSSTGYGKIRDISERLDGKFDISLTSVKGVFIEGQQVDLESIEVTNPDNMVLESINGFSATITGCPTASLNGIPFAEICNELTVVDVDSIDTVVVRTPTSATASGRFGGTGVFATFNTKFEIFNVSGEYNTYGVTENWSYVGINHNFPVNQDYRETEARLFSPKTDIHVDRPLKIATERNMSRNGRENGMIVIGQFSGLNNRVSPVLNLETFNITTVSNRVGVEDQTKINVSPNSVGRFKPETHPTDGSHAYKYVTRTISLAKPAVDLMIAVDVYKDYYADFDIYYRAVKPYVSDDIGKHEWVKIDISRKVSNINVGDYTSYEIYARDSSVGFPEEFISFQVKLVGRTSNPSKPPLFKNLRSIAIT